MTLSYLWSQLQANCTADLTHKAARVFNAYQLVAYSIAYESDPPPPPPFLPSSPPIPITDHLPMTQEHNIMHLIYITSPVTTPTNNDTAWVV